MMGHGLVPLMVTAAVGYWVVTKAQEQKGGTRKLGIYLGAAIIVASILMAACKTYCFATGTVCPMAGGKWGKACPVTGRQMPMNP